MEWISVEDKLPKEYKKVLVSNGVTIKNGGKHPCVELGTFHPLCGWRDSNLYYLKVTHWMPIPEPPK